MVSTNTDEGRHMLGVTECTETVCCVVLCCGVAVVCASGC